MSEKYLTDAGSSLIGPCKSNPKSCPKIRACTNVYLFFDVWCHTAKEPPFRAMSGSFQFSVKREKNIVADRWRKHINNRNNTQIGKNFIYPFFRFFSKSKAYKVSLGLFGRGDMKAINIGITISANWIGDGFSPFTEVGLSKL